MYFTNATTNNIDNAQCCARWLISYTANPKTHTHLYIPCCVPLTPPHFYKGVL
jgi:transposase-like protein